MTYLQAAGVGFMAHPFLVMTVRGHAFEGLSGLFILACVIVLIKVAILAAARGRRWTAITMALLATVYTLVTVDLASRGDQYEAGILLRDSDSHRSDGASCQWT